MRWPAYAAATGLGSAFARDAGQRIGPDSDPMATYGYAVEQLNAFGLAYIHVIEGATQGPRDSTDFDFQALRRAFHGIYIANNGYDAALAQEAQPGTSRSVAFGRAFIANPTGRTHAHRRAPQRA